MSERLLLCILDGFGHNPNSPLKNAIQDASTPNIDRLFQNYPFTTIIAGGEAVGLPKGLPGNSEVGHMNLGAGRRVRQDLVIINECIRENKLESKSELLQLISFAKAHDNIVHLVGLLSDGGVHSHIDHLLSLADIFNKHGIKIILHAFTDGRDTPQANAEKYIHIINKHPHIHWGSMQGRSIGMDRDRRWNKINECYTTIIGKGKKTALTPLEYLKSEYALNRFDEFISPVLFDNELKDGQAMLFFNFRPDRAIQLTLALNDHKFKEFEITTRPGFFLCMTPYVQDFIELPILFDKEKLKQTLAEYLSEAKLKQCKIAETEKYAHVTYFFNGGTKTPFPLEEQILIPSPREVSTYDKKPEMSAKLVGEKLREKLQDSSISFYAVNFANADMVGHTGNYEAAVKAIEVLDYEMGLISEYCLKHNITMIITADHGNADQMIYENGEIHTSHTEAPVPFNLISSKYFQTKLTLAHDNGSLEDVAPTILSLLKLPSSSFFTGSPIFKLKD